eukprot:7723968-Pyramimonas_sp.AAC.1
MDWAASSVGQLRAGRRRPVAASSPPVAWAAWAVRRFRAGRRRSFVAARRGHPRKQHETTVAPAAIFFGSLTI